MLPSVGNSSHDRTLLETAYEVGAFIQSLYTEDQKDSAEKTAPNYSVYFREGPDPYRNQTKEGLVLETYYGMPSSIHTPYGEWTILGVTACTVEKIFKAIQGPLGLELIQEGEQTSSGYVSPRWAIRKWKNLNIEKAVYRETSEYIPATTVKEVWKKFTANHKEVLSPTNNHLKARL